MLCSELHAIYLLSLLASSSAMAIVPKYIRHAPHLRRDHGNPGVQIPGPQTTSVALPAIAETPTPAVISVSSSIPLSTIQHTSTTTPPKPSSSTHLSSISTSSISTSVPLTTHTSSTSSTSLSTIASSSPPTIPTIAALAPPSGPSSSSGPAATQQQPTTLIVISILGLLLGLLGLFILALVLLRRQARRKRALGLRREVELLKIDIEGASVLRSENGDSGGDGDGAGREGRFVGVGVGTVAGTGKWEEAGVRVCDEDEERGQALPPYSR